VIKQDEVLQGTLVWVAPFYNRSGYAVGARATVSALHKAGVRIRVFSVNEVEPGIDDCDMALIKSLESTPPIPPITCVVSHVPSKSWLGIELPEPNVRIIATTFDSSAQGNLPPPEWISVCNEMDQVWLMTEKERDIFVAAGVSPEKIHFVCWPHHWQNNPLLPPISKEPSDHNRSFRFLSIAMFQPRRRWDTLIEAYLEEFKSDENVELYLKVNYPSWHPIPGKPRQDFHDLVSSLRQKTGSPARIVIDEDLGTRTGIVRLIDSCNAYVSTDTATTAPVSEARVRQRMVIIPEGLGLGMPPDQVISVDPNASFPLTEGMLLYQPHHKGASMPQLHVQDVRKAMRNVFNMSAEERHVHSVASASRVPNFDSAVPEAINAIRSAWQRKAQKEKHDRYVGRRIVWEGSQLVCHSLALVNRELCLQLIDSDYEVSIIPYEEDELSPGADPRFEKIVQRTRKPLSGKADVHVRHQWPPDFDPPEEGYWVIMQPWEFGSLPKAWLHPMKTMVDELWVPSSTVRECFVKSGIPEDRVFVVPNGVAVSTFNPSAVPLDLSTRKRFKFLFVGGTIPRKGIDILLETYMNAFSDKDDVCLVIKDMGGKTFYRNTTARRMIQAYQSKPGAAKIEYMDRILSEYEMAGLYTACDCLVHPYRGEGFGLPIAEAMACGLPVIITGKGAALDFCTRDAAYLLPSRVIHFPEKQVDGMETVDFPWLVEPDHTSLKKMMRNVYEHPEEARVKGKAARIQIEKNFTWEKAAEALRERLKALRTRPIRRFVEYAPILEKEADSASLADDNLKHPEAMIRQARKETDGIGKSLSGPAPGKASDREVRSEPDAWKRSHRPADSSDIADFLNAHGELLFRKDKRDHARACFEMAIEHDPDHAVAHSNLGVVLWELGELETALESFHRALELAPEDSDILYNSSKALIDAEELDIAADLLKLYLQRNPRHEAVWEEYGSLVHQIGTSEWTPEGVSVEAAEVYAAMGKELIDAKDYTGAGEALHRALRLDSQRVEAYFQLGRLHLVLGQEDEAVGLLKEALRLDPCHKECESTLSATLSSQQVLCEAAILPRPDAPDTA
jgi:glycosyltransferase involved in cell wall biosynthesis/Flp pilus assembly protein TadD